MYLCIYMYISVYIYICPYGSNVCIYVSIYISVCIYIHMDLMYVSMYLYIYQCMCICPYGSNVCIYVSFNVLWIYVYGWVDECVFQVVHNRAILPCHYNLPMSQVSIHAISSPSLATTYLHIIHLPDSIVTSFLFLYHPSRNALPVLLYFVYQ